MRRVLIYPVLCLSLGVGVVGCSRDKSESVIKPNDSAAQQRPAAADDQIEVTGCLTSNADTNQFVLTANANALTSLTNRAGAGDRESFHYQLVGGQDLGSYVGREVVVRGSIKGHGKDLEVESKEKTTQEPSVKGRDDAKPAVKTEEEIEMQVERLQVASVTPTGSACQIGQKQ